MHDVLVRKPCKTFHKYERSENKKNIEPHEFLVIDLHKNHFYASFVTEQQFMFRDLIDLDRFCVDFVVIITAERIQ